MVALQVENVIASSSLGKEVELVRLGTELEHAQYTRGLTPSVIVDLDGDGAGGRTGLVFGSGKLYVTGVDDLTAGREAVTQLRKAIKVLDPKVSLRKGVKLENMVTRADLGTTLDRPELHHCGRTGGGRVGWDALPGGHRPGRSRQSRRGR